MSNPEFAVVSAQPWSDIAIECFSPALEVVARVRKDDPDRFSAWHMRRFQLATHLSSVIHAAPFDG